MKINKRKIGNTNIEVTELGMGTAPIGGWPIEVSENEAFNTLERAWEKGIRYFDTAPRDMGLVWLRRDWVNLSRIKIGKNLLLLQRLED